MKHKLIGMVGLRRSGKDTAAAALIKHGYAGVKFAGALKAMLHAYLHYIGISPEDSERMIEGELKETPTVAFKNRTPRYAMQTLGTEWGRDLIHKNLWVNSTLRRAAMFDKAVITDARFQNEVQAIHDAGGVIIRVTRPGVSADSHISEQETASLKHDYEITNDSTIDALHAKMLALTNK